jgi:hypothetical protein
MPKDIPEIEESPKNHSSSKIIFIPLVFALAISLITAGYFFSKYQSLSQEVKTPKKTTPPVVTSKKTAVPQTIVKGPSFQEILSSSCENIIISPTVSYFGIKEESLPVSLGQPVNSLTCAGEENSNFVSIEYDNHNQIHLYDNNSKELGHGGPSFLGSLSPLYDDGQIKWSFIPGWNEVGCNKLDELGVTIRGERKLTLQSGETIFANTSKTAIDPGDSRLVDILKDNLEFSDCINDKIVKIEGTEEKVKQRFFKNFDNLASPEKERVDEIRKILMAITPKEIVATKTSAPQTTLTESTALSIAEKQIGACDCTKRTATITPSSAGVWAITITDTGLMDDSISAQQTNGTITSQNNNYVWKTTSTLFRCAPNRGHQNFSSALCD